MAATSSKAQHIRHNSPKTSCTLYQYFQPVYIYGPFRHHKTIIIVYSNRYAHTEVETYVKNPSSESREITFTMVIPANAFISNFSMTLRGGQVPNVFSCFISIGIIDNIACRQRLETSLTSN